MTYEGLAGIAAYLHAGYGLVLHRVSDDAITVS